MMECHLLPSHRLQQPHGSPQRAQRPLSRRLCAIPAHTPAATQAVYVFSTPGCQFCKRAKQTLAEQGVAYRDVDVSSSSELRQALQQATGQRTVPQVFVNGELVGGSDALSSKVADGSLATLLSAAPAASSTTTTSLPAALQEALDQALSQQQQQQQQQQRQGVLQLPPDLQQLASDLEESSRAGAGGPVTGGTAAGQPAAFTGRALIDWIQQQQQAGSSTPFADRQAAVAAAQQLLTLNVVTIVSQQQPSPSSTTFKDDNTQLYRLRCDAPRDLPWGAALNTGYWWSTPTTPTITTGAGADAGATPTQPSPPSRPAGLVAEELRGRILSLFDAYLSSDGRSVRYGALRRDPAFWEYVDATAELQTVDLSPLSREELMSFAINIYNALCIHALVVHGPDRYNSFFGRLEFFRKAARYNIGGCDYVLDDIENGILRGNAPGAATAGMLLKLPGLSKGPFRQGDPRARHVVSPVDPRIHFALNCGAVSCPPIKLYHPDTLQEGLAAAAEAFCATEVAVDVAAKQVSLSQIFDWYYPDFGPDRAARLRWLLPFLPPDTRAGLEQLLADDPQAQRVRVRYTPYDWTINAAE